MKRIFTLFALSISISALSQVIELQSFATGFTSPVDIAHAGDERLFVVQQTGAIRIVSPAGVINPTNFLTLTNATIISGGERGLLGLAFHPEYATNGYFYVNYTRASDGATVIARYTVSANPDVADASSAVILMTIPQPYENHNGGTIKFGPDGYLYIGMGDGGSGGDPGDRAQDITDNLGKMLRIDVNSGSPYGIPADNPYVGIAGNDEIWIVGLRNPWKFSFDSQNGDMWIADVGQENVEEINRVTAGSTNVNLGWDCYEGNALYTPGCPQVGTTYTFPTVTYSSASGSGSCSVTGGYVYRGTAIPNFANKYFFADYCQNRIGTVDTNTLDVTYTNTAAFASGSFVTFGEDFNRELYVAGSGTVYKIKDSSLGRANFESASITMSPNPANGNVSINLPNTSLPAQASFYDVTGKMLMTQSLDSDSTMINIEMLQSGIYVVKVQDSTGAVSSSKLSIK